MCVKKQWLSGLSREVKHLFCTLLCNILLISSLYYIIKIFQKYCFLHLILLYTDTLAGADFAAKKKEDRCVCVCVYTHTHTHLSSYLSTLFFALRPEP
jgi:hypothetical protein